MPTDKNLDYYETFGVKPFADDETIKKRYHKLVKTYHPDSFEGDKNFVDEEMIKKINEAYETLSNPEKRKAYDKNHNTSKTENTSYSDYRSAQEKRKQEERERLWKDRYDELFLKKRVASSENDFINLAKEFRELAKNFFDLKGYQDTINQAKECDMLATKAKEKAYAQLLLAKNQLEKNNESTSADFRKLAQYFREFGMDYQDVRSLWEECIHIASVKEQEEQKRQERERQEREKEYRTLLEKKERVSSENEYRNLADEFRAMGGYQEATAMANECEKAADYYRNLQGIFPRAISIPALTRLMCMPESQKMIGIEGFKKHIPQREYNKEMSFGQRIAERSNDLTWFFFGGEYKKSDETIIKITPGIKDFPVEEKNLFEKLCGILGIEHKNETEIRAFIHDNPTKTEIGMEYIPGLISVYDQWVNKYGIDAQEAQQ